MFCCSLPLLLFPYFRANDFLSGLRGSKGSVNLGHCESGPDAVSELTGQTVSLHPVP